MVGLPSIDNDICMSAWLRRQICRNGVVLVTCPRDVDLLFGRASWKAQCHRSFEDVSAQMFRQQQLTRQEGMDISEGHSEH